MALIAKRIGWEDHPEARRREYVIRLVADDPSDIAGITAGDVWNSVPLSLMRADESRVHAKTATMDALVQALIVIRNRAEETEAPVDASEDIDDFRRDLRHIEAIAKAALALVRNERK
ncbi:hypothetical protein GN330_22850 [Nitratireductor sp. CAU 1489]|uniref:Uncharacterized protein n=1 Tax=Nitratireductor arenosus TaxID=2682096 RepID=A0A844QPW9_9HYPH|nr:hypothetical protein [Nitratireductor arenosus]MVB00089.1 hypothetical protein [Nitratireductor arenosus]